MQTFQDLGLSPELLRSIEELGFKTPSPVQAQSLPILLGTPTDFIGLAATGTGKTAAFGLPLLERVDATKNEIQGVILCPTRELAMQVSEQINVLGRYKNIKSVAIYGGSSFQDQVRGLKSGATIVVGTPGRVIDHMKRGTLNLSGVKTMILDEADEMISMGFIEDIETILDSVPRKESQIWLFSATMSKEVRKVADTYLRNPQQVQVNRTEMLSNTVKQFFYLCRESDKPEILCKLIEAADDFYGLVFCQTKSLVADLGSYLTGRGYRVDTLHGDKDQKEREHTMRQFRERRVTILICTDVASRGIDVKDITHVINYSLPRELDSYVHRIGRTARSGKTGLAFCLVTPSHRHLIGRIEKMTKSRMEEGIIPTRKEIGFKRAAKIQKEFLDQPFYTRALESLGDEWKKSISGMEREEIVARFISLIASDVFNDREIKPVVLSQKEDEDASGGGREPRRNRNHRGGGGGGGFRPQGFKHHRKKRQDSRGGDGAYQDRPKRKAFKIG